MTLFRAQFTIAILSCLAVADASGGEWTLPIAGNTFPGQGGNESIRFDRRDALRLADPMKSYSTYFRVDRPGTIALSIEAVANAGKPTIVAMVGEKTMCAELNQDGAHAHLLGSVEVEQPGYVKVDFRLAPRQNGDRASVTGFLISSDTELMSLDFVKNDAGNMFYWGRRGPSVHLKYVVPANADLMYAYSEIVVPEGRDPIGSYFMANGFGEGYFGIQVNSLTERRVLFSVWSPFRTDDPNDIPDDQRVVTLGKGDGVQTKDFGNEGAGGQSFLVFPWAGEKTYRFLTEVKPEGNGSTRYTSWFGDAEDGGWHLIASFRRPKTNKYLTGFHSFLENFSPSTGNQTRSARYQNQWVGDKDGHWHEVTQATLTGDGTARGRHRLDYAGGSESDHFYLRNCGFFSDTVELDQNFERSSDSSRKPEIDVNQLPRSSATQRSDSAGALSDDDTE